MQGLCDRPRDFEHFHAKKCINTTRLCSSKPLLGVHNGVRDGKPLGE